MKRAIITLCLVTACARCAPDAPHVTPYTVVDEGEHVVVLSDDDDRALCAGSMAHMDDFIARLATEFGVQPPSDEERIQFHWVSSEAVDEVCDGSVRGCAAGEDVYALHAPFNHELVHALAFSFGLPRPLFAEGLAVVYEDLGRRPLTDYFVGGPTDILALVELDQVEFSEATNSYRLAGAFISFLIDRYGLDDFLRAYSSIARNASKESIDQVFRDTFGATLEDTVTEFENLHISLGVLCRQPQFGAKLMECSAPALSWDGESLTLERTLSCDQDGAIGPFDDKVQVHHTIMVPTHGVYELRMRGDEQAAEQMPDFTLVDQAVTGVSLTHCGGCDTPAWMATWHGSEPRLAELPPGLYSLRLHGPAAMSVSLGFTLVRVADSLDTGG